MNEEYLQNLHNHLGIEDDYDTWVSSVKDNEEYLRGLHKHIGVTDTYENWNSAIFGGVKKKTNQTLLWMGKVVHQMWKMVVWPLQRFQMKT